jgi:hypothetical protein
MIDQGIAEEKQSVWKAGLGPSLRWEIALVGPALVGGAYPSQPLIAPDLACPVSACRPMVCRAESA